ncbi:cytochrome C oxidase subunit IV family protein [bacterium]|nr:cytochrome C oxidase subunit IV family protein [bacterium]
MSNANPAAAHAHDHHIVPVSVFAWVWVALLVLTAITVGASVYYPGHVGILVAMIVTPIKAALILMYFMHLKYEKKVFVIMFLTAIGIFAIFLGLTFFDYLFR